MQHYLDGVCSYRSWIIKFTRASTQKENHLRSAEKAPSTRFLATFSAQALSFLSSILSLLNPLAHLWLTSLEEGYWSGSRKSTKQSIKCNRISSLNGVWCLVCSDDAGRIDTYCRLWWQGHTGLGCDTGSWYSYSATRKILSAHLRFVTTRLMATHAHINCDRIAWKIKQATTLFKEN